MLASDNLLPNKDFTYKFLESHLLVARSVANGNSEVGAVSWKSLKKFIREDKIEPSTLRIIGVSFPIPLDPWLLNINLSNQLKSDISSSFYQLSNRSILTSLGSDGYVPANKSTYNPLILKANNFYESIMSNP